MKIAIIGGGIGGLSAALHLLKAGLDVHVYEQSPRIGEIGAGIQISPNASRLLIRLGLKPALDRAGVRPLAVHQRRWDDGRTLQRAPVGAEVETTFGAPYYHFHRGDLAEILGAAVPAERLHVGHKLVGLEQKGERIVAHFDNGASIEADLLVGADGVNSIVRTSLFTDSEPRFAGRIAYRTTYPARLLDGFDIGDCTKWWGEDRHIVVYPVKADRSEVYFVTSQPEPEFGLESWSEKGDVNVVRAAFEGFHPTVQKVLAACPEVHKRVLVDHEPLERWVDGNVALLGDACHPMTPYMAQGAAMAIEDAAILSRCLAGIDRDRIADALATYEATRKERTAKVQLTSWQNSWGKGVTDTDWVYGYNAWTAPLMSSS